MTPVDPLLVPVWTPPQPVAGGVELFVFDLDHSPAHDEPRPHIRRRAVGRRILPHLLASRLRVAPEEIEMDRTPGGKPVLVRPQAPLAFNVSYTRRWFAAALATAGQVGVDVEALDLTIDAMDVARHHFHASELVHLRSLATADRPLAFYRFWTAKEAVLKALGTGLSLDPRLIEIELMADLRLRVCGYDMQLWQWQFPLGGDILILTFARQDHGDRR